MAEVGGLNENFSKMLPSAEPSSMHSCHPVTSWLTSLDKDDIDSESVRNFLKQFSNSDGENLETLTGFMKGYVQFKVWSSEAGKDGAMSPSVTSTDKLINNLSYLAFRKRILNKSLYLSEVLRVIGAYNQGGACKIARESIESRTFGLMRCSTNEDCHFSLLRLKHRKVLELKFSERFVEDFLVAVQIKNACIKNWDKKRSVMPKIVRKAARMLPDTGYVWRMACGLIAKQLRQDNKSAGMLKKLVKQLLEEVKALTGMVSLDVTRLGAEIVYESGNLGDLTDLIPDFTFNSSINYTANPPGKTRRSETGPNLLEKFDESETSQRVGNSGKSETNSGNSRKSETDSGNSGKSETRLLPSECLGYAVKAVGYVIGCGGDLYSVRLSGCRLNAVSIKLVCNSVSVVSDNYIQILDLSDNPISDAGVRRLQSFLVKANRLVDLDLSSCSINQSGAVALSKVLVCFPLQRLNLANNNIGADGLLHLVKNFKFIPTLEHLNLSSNSLLDYSLLHLYETLPLLSSLVALNLSHNHISDRGIDPLTRFIPASLTNLYLRHNNITDRGARVLASVIARSRSLQYVDVAENVISPEGADCLVKAAQVATAAQSVKTVITPSASLTPSAMLVATAMILMASVNPTAGITSTLESEGGVRVVVNNQREGRKSFVQQFSRRASRRSVSAGCTVESRGSAVDTLWSDNDAGHCNNNKTPVNNVSGLSNACTLESSGGRGYTLSDLEDELSGSEWDDCVEFTPIRSSVMKPYDEPSPIASLVTKPLSAFSPIRSLERKSYDESSPIRSPVTKPLGFSPIISPIARGGMCGDAWLVYHPYAASYPPGVGQICEVTRECEAVTTRCEGVNAKCEGANSEFETMNARCEAMSTECEALFARCEATGARYEAMNAECEALFARCEAKDATCETLNAVCESDNFDRHGIDSNMNGNNVTEHTIGSGLEDNNVTEHTIGSGLEDNNARERAIGSNLDDNVTEGRKGRSESRVKKWGFSRVRGAWKNFNSIYN